MLADDTVFWLPRRCLSPVTGEVLEAADNFARAADADLLGDLESVKKFLRAAETPMLRSRVESIWGRMSVDIHRYRKIDGLGPDVPKESRIKVRMPNAQEKRAIRARDGWHCRFCAGPVIDPVVRGYFNRKYPEALPWGSKNHLQHAGYQNLWLQYDHVVPHSRGGDNSIDNVVTACAPCNFGRGNYTLAEMGLLDPRDFPPTQSNWDGLSRLFVRL